MLLHLHIDAMHIFESRQEHFADDEVLQEAMITWATAQSNRTDSIILSTSTGIRDLEHSAIQTLPVCQVIRNDDQNTIALPTQNNADELRHFQATLNTYDLKVSTGPVVAFRSTDYLSEKRKRGTVPLLWLQHVQHMQISWPIYKKREHIVANAKSAWMLVPNANMVILRRFSPKEDLRRITAAPYIAGSLPGDVLGLENHVNYIYRPGGQISRDEVIGLSAYLNSSYVDRYLRRVSGNTQVNAADLRNLPLPSLKQLIMIGQSLEDSSTLAQADKAVASILQKRMKVEVA
jgi:adenine-specific DNA-methyltransferase